mgnify:CR=1 FL=1
MNKYSIVSVVNKEYEKFAKVFLKSAIEKINLENIAEICILNTGLPDEVAKELYSLSDKIRIVKHTENINSNSSWDEGWQKNVLLKKKFVKNYIETEKRPTFMIDIDCMFIGDISALTTFDLDVVLCDRSDLWGGMPYIASFVGFLNVEKSIKFLEEWISEMNTISGFETKETPALNVMSQKNEKYKMAGLSHKIIGLYHEECLSDETRILHFKGGGESQKKTKDEAIMIRFNRFKKFKTKIKEYLSV